jgi:hypothetical protein
MAKIWKEPLDEERHKDFMSSATVGGGRPIADGWVYFVRECSFTFQFMSRGQIQECLEFFSVKVHPARRRPGITLEHYWQHWYERLPRGLLAESKRVRIKKALERALDEFGPPED